MAGLFGGGKSKTVKPEAPVRMPDPDDPALIEARKRRLTELLGRGGRASTVMTNPDGTATTGSAGQIGA